MEDNKLNDFICDFVAGKTDIENNPFTICFVNNKLYKIPTFIYNKISELKNLIDSFSDKFILEKIKFSKINNLINFTEEEKKNYIKEYNDLIKDVNERYNTFDNLGLKVETKNIKINDKIVEYYIDNPNFDNDTLKLPDTLLKGIEILIKQGFSSGYIDKKLEDDTLVVCGYWSLK